MPRSHRHKLGRRCVQGPSTQHSGDIASSAQPPVHELTPLKERTSVLIFSNSPCRSEKAVISVGHTKVKSSG